ncbi:TEA/ATTS domain family-domain-containing protein [Cercophora scortea]|uniref:TEA/ATTS domain family-domain-containing protein n=1 Tax=Cercophora scortea TaxID=314031 RepID=A0AAE0MLJ2_9PEZI|nr:TEA/ATTS domain family-domain-containing protein [Cercophora scortea]
MQLQKRLPVLSSQCYSPVPDYAVEDGHALHSTSRQPLRESTGNAQHQLERLARFQAHRLNLDPLLIPSSSMPTPPIVPTQSLGGSTYDSPGYSRLQQRHKIHVQRRRRWGSRGINPMSLSAQFLAYRKKQADKDDKSDQKWADVLEEAFLDALLLVPPMGRTKFSMRGRLYGRNMLIAEYLWVAYCASLPPDTEPDERMRRDRKQVSSHIQVLKNFFSHHTTFHFFFPGKERKEDKSKDTGETVSFKNNPVLVALNEGRLPDVRLNYDYFAQILAQNDQVTIRPRRTWIFVSNPDLVVGDDGCGHLPATGDKLDKSEYPHLKRNLEREKWAKEEQQIFKGSLVHEFTKEMHQTYSSTVKELSREWESSFPDLHQRLESVVANDPSCDILHMHSTLELKDKRGFPDGSELNSWIEINIEQPRLLNHRWKVRTQLVRPTVLSYAKENPHPKAVYETSADIAIQYQHRPGCDGPRNGGQDPCDCISQRCKRDWVTVPFPADEWARTLTNCAQYPAHPFTGSARRANRGRAAVKKEGEDEDEDSEDSDGSSSTQMELVPQIAMMQEIWSCPPEAPHDRNTFPYGADSQSGSTPTTQRWTRRALILWTFDTVHSVNREGKLVTAQNGKTTWRFLTVIDPTSQYHQQQFLLSGPSSASSNYGGDSMTPGGGFSPTVSAGPAPDRDAIMSPTPNYEQQFNSLSAHMSKNYTAPTWEPQRMHHHSYGAHMMAPSVGGQAGGANIPAGFDMLDSLGGHSRLVTPPPTASLSSSFAPSFDSGLSSAEHLYMTAHSHPHSAAAGLSATDSQALSDISAVTDPFLASASSSSFDMGGGVYDDHGSSDHWDSSGAHAHGHHAVTGIDASNWPSGYTTTAAGGGSNNPGVLGWVQTPPGSRNNSVGHMQPHMQNIWTTTPVTSAAYSIMAPATTLWATTSGAAVLDDEGDYNGGPAEGSHDWVHVRSSISTAGGSDLSQDWEEIVNQAASASTSESSAAHHQHLQHHQQQEELQQQHMMNTTHTNNNNSSSSSSSSSNSQLAFPIRAQQGTKRSRSDSLAGECDSYPRTSMPKLTHHHHQTSTRPSPRHDGGLEQEPW